MNFMVFLCFNTEMTYPIIINSKVIDFLPVVSIAAAHARSVRGERETEDEGQRTSAPLGSARESDRNGAAKDDSFRLGTSRQSQRQS